MRCTRCIGRDPRMGDSGQMHSPAARPAGSTICPVQAGAAHRRAMLAASPPGWIRLDLLARVSVDYQELVLHSARPDGTVGQIPISASCRPPCSTCAGGCTRPRSARGSRPEITADPPMQTTAQPQLQRRSTLDHTAAGTGVSPRPAGIPAAARAGAGLAARTTGTGMTGLADMTTTDGAA